MRDLTTKGISADASRLIDGLAWTYLSVVIQGVLKVGVLVVLARLLTPRDFGLIGFALMCTSCVERICQCGVSPALVQAHHVTASTIQTSKLLNVTFSAVCAALVCWAAPVAARFFAEPALESIIAVMAVGCVFEGMAATPDALLQREMRFKEIMIADNASNLIAMAGVATCLALLGFGVWALVVATLVMKIARLLIVSRCVGHSVGGRWSWGEAVRLLRTGIGFSLSRLLNFCSLQGDNFVVGRLLGVDALGMYSRAYQLMTLPAMYVGQVIERVMFPSMAKKQDSKDRLSREFLLTLEAIGIVALPAGVVLNVLAREIILVGFGSKWADIIPIVSILSLGVFFRTAYKCSDTVVRSVGAVYRYAAQQALYTFLVIAGTLTGALLAGLTGVAIGVVVAVALNYLCMTSLCSHLICVSARDILRAHASGVWVTVWVAAGLMWVVPELRTAQLDPFLVLLTGLGISGGMWLSGLLFAYKVLPTGVLSACAPLVRPQCLRVVSGLQLLRERLKWS